MTARCKGLSLMSGGLDSQLAVRVLERAGAEVEAVAFVTPFFGADRARAAAAALGVRLHIVDFLDDEVRLLKNPPHGFGGAMNPCIDCHAQMIRRAGEMMLELGCDFVATGEVRGQRPMSQNAQALVTVERSSGLAGRLVRPLSARLLEPTIPETEGKLDRSLLLDISGRSRERQIALAAEFGIVDYPSPAGGCRLTEAAYGRKLKDLLEHEGLDDRRLIELLAVGRHFRLPGGSALILGRNAQENELLRSERGGRLVEPPPGVMGPTAYIPRLAAEGDLQLAAEIVRNWSRGTGDRDREPYRAYQLT